MAPSPRPEPRTRAFVDRHVGPHAGDVDVMLATIGYGDLTARTNFGHTLSVFEGLLG